MDKIDQIIVGVSLTGFVLNLMFIIALHQAGGNYDFCDDFAAIVLAKSL
jgi:hypothetical protein